MSKHLAHLLGADEKLVGEVVGELESLSGFDSHDVRLLADLNQTRRSKIRQLGLDPNDTKPKELYQSLISRLSRDIQQFETALVPKEQDQPVDVFRQLTKLVQISGISGEVWTLKSSSARKLLLQRPPKKLMKLLGYRSVQSMLKRENIDVVYLTLDAIESDSYMKGLKRAYQGLNSSNFESRSIRIVSMQRSCWHNLPAAQQRLTSASLPRGSIAVWPTSNSRAKSLAVQFWLVLEAIEHLRFSSLMLKLHQAGGDFNQDIVHLLQRHHSADPQQLAELLGPHLQSDDLHHFEPIETLARLHPSFRWWVTNDHLAASYKSGPLSFHPSDVLKNYVRGLPYEQRIVSHFRNSLWNNLVERYLRQPSIEEFILSHLSSNRWQYEPVALKETEKETSTPRIMAGIYE